MKLAFSLAACAAALLYATPVISAQDGKHGTNGDANDNSPEAAATPASPKSSKRRAVSSARKSLNVEAKAFAFSSRDRAARPLIVRNSNGDPKQIAQLQEDLAVMSRILEKATAEFKEEREEAAGIPILALGANQKTRAMYLEDYGVVFTLTTGLPLRAEAKAQEVEEKLDKPGNEEWNEVRNELFGERRPPRGERAGKVEFDPHQFEEFRDALLEAMRQAANIRNLNGNDWITVIVRGRGHEDLGDRRFDVFLQNGDGRDAVITPFPGGEERGDLSTMVLRIKKAELDQAARQPRGKDDLKKKVSLTLY
jgi:hypothetical protein